MCNLMMQNPLDFSNIKLVDLIDVAILSHGFLPYKRDYCGPVTVVAGGLILSAWELYEHKRDHN